MLVMDTRTEIIANIVIDDQRIVNLEGVVGVGIVSQHIYNPEAYLKHLDEVQADINEFQELLREEG